jgi:hypothetical protein
MSLPLPCFKKILRIDILLMQKEWKREKMKKKCGRERKEHVGRMYRKERVKKEKKNNI